MSSKLKLIKPIDYSKEIKITQFFIDPAMMEQQRQRIKAALPKEMNDETMMQYELLQLSIKDNVFSAIMNYLAEHFEFEIDQAEVKKLIEQLKASGLGAQREELLANMADKIIKKGLMFDYLSEQWKVKVSDNEVKNMLDIYYEKTNQSIHDVLNDQQKFESVRSSIFEEKMVLKTISMFLIRFNMQNPNYVEESETDKSSESKSVN
ncbi:MPN555 family protein chaperone [Mycoplasmoides gallisepticum]|uniref:MPN555 family protein chaperone n=1 Tax=Mycoplasmoides gallisepticum TaxID=2096 RepID=UPI00334B2F3E